MCCTGGLIACLSFKVATVMAVGLMFSKEVLVDVITPAGVEANCAYPTPSSNQCSQVMTCIQALH